MDALLKLTPADQLDAFVEVNRAMGLDAASVEKDFWVCWTLREIFSDRTTTWNMESQAEAQHRRRGRDDGCHAPKF